MKKIVLSQQDHGYGQIGGAPLLKDLSLWPANPQTGGLMTPIMTLTEQFQPARFVPPGMAITVFLAVEQQQDGSFNRPLQRRYTVNQQSELQSVLSGGFARVILHELASHPLEPSTPPLLLERAFIDFEEMTDEEHDEEHEDEDSGIGLSKPSGRPCWLQDPIYEPPRYMFMMQLVDADVAQASPPHGGLFGEGNGYLFVDMQARRGKEGDDAGFFFIQFT
ncbi:hypothetical protein ACSFEV_17370 [Pseudomonas fulva]|uniref:hypothetical protein n=1 Tax=Pseudomonas TaxID=286 RepID=UPI000ED672A9|nr:MULTISPECIES: hypothetical protein [Pseudomonas]MBF8726852.1 hypothetical protein [Pseudomonas putida]NIX94324.1 hypothetical protein [Pseudomonas fulva]HAL66247.1 hypothetical protein [Pseudomonas sp.]